MGFTTLDYIILVVYLVAVALLGIVMGGRQRTAKDYFLGKDTIPWWVVCFSIVAAETSTLTFISIPGLAYVSNLSFLQVTVGYLLGRIVVSAVLLPAYYKGELSTAYAFLESRFGVPTRRFASGVFLGTRLAADGVRLFATAIPLQLIVGFDYPVVILVLAVVAFLYTFAGGVRGIIWVDAVQMFIYLGGAILALVVLGMEAEGGLPALAEAAAESGKFRIFDLSFGSDFFQRPYTLPAGLLGGAFLSMASHGTDQLIIQRVLTTKALLPSRKALVGSGLIVILQFAVFLLVGILLFAFYAGADVGELGLTRSDEIFPHYIIQYFPPGITGFVIAGLMAAALSTLAGSMSSMASSTMLDLLKPYFGGRLSAEAEVRLSRAVTGLAAVLLVGAAMFFMNTTQTVVELALSIASFTYGGLLGTFLLGVLFKRTTQGHALTAFIAGILIMITVISLQVVAWTWYTVVGVTVTVIIGTIASTIFPGSRRGES
jgi:SSS family transporter